MASTRDPADLPPTRFARALAIVAGLNVFAALVYGPIWWAINSVIYLSAHSAAVPARSTSVALSDSVGLFALPVAWEVFAIGGAVSLAVAIVAWSPSRRAQLGPPVQANPFRTDPGYLIYAGFFVSVLGSAWIYSYSGIQSVFDPYLVGPLLAAAAGVVSFRRWQLDAPSLPATRKAPPAPSLIARSLGIVLAVDFIAMLVLGFGGVVANQAIYLGKHDGALPPGSEHPYKTGLDLWAGRMPIPLPWELFAALSLLLLLVTLIAWPKANQFGPSLGTRVFLRRTTPPSLLAMGILFFLAEAEVNLYYGSGQTSDLAFIGPAIALVVVLLCLLRLLRSLFRALGSSKPRKKAGSSRARSTKTGGSASHG